MCHVQPHVESSGSHKIVLARTILDYLKHRLYVYLFQKINANGFKEHSNVRILDSKDQYKLRFSTTQNSHSSRAQLAEVSWVALLGWQPGEIRTENTGGRQIRVKYRAGIWRRLLGHGHGARLRPHALLVVSPGEGGVRVGRHPLG